MSLGEITQLLDDANQDLSAQLAADVVIIEDEPLIAMELEELVESLGHRVVELRDGKSGRGGRADASPRSRSRRHPARRRQLGPRRRQRVPAAFTCP